MWTLIDRFEAAASAPVEGRSGQVTFVNGDVYDTIPWAQFHEEARVMAAVLQSRGVEAGSHVAAIGPTTRSFVTALQAIWLCGATVVTMPLPMRLASLDQFIAQTRSRIRNADASLVVIDPELAAFITPEEGDPPFMALPELFPEANRPSADQWRRPSVDPDSLAVLQFTSGSTSEPKGVMLPNRNICHNLDGAIEGASLTMDDVLVSWLPLYHDMGLIGLLLIPMTTGIQLVQGAPQDFLARPARWMQWIHDFRGTGTAGPNFSYSLAARSLRRAEGLDLSSLTICLIGAEPIDPDTFRRFFAAGERFGLKESAAFPAFGMAETCIAAVFPVRGEGMRTDIVDPDRLGADGRAVPVEPGTEGARELAVLGRPIRGLTIRIVHPETGETLGDREVGELQISGTSLTSGYYRAPEATAELIEDGWLHTGDLAYLADGELVMCGRIKDVIIVGGRNVYPQDVEWEVGRVDGVRTGNVIAYGTDMAAGKQHIVVVAETKAEDYEALERAIVHQVTESVGVPPWQVLLVAPGSVPKTSSGKLQRSLCRRQITDGTLTPLNA